MCERDAHLLATETGRDAGGTSVAENGTTSSVGLMARLQVTGQWRRADNTDLPDCPGWDHDQLWKKMVIWRKATDSLMHKCLFKVWRLFDVKFRQKFERISDEDRESAEFWSARSVGASFRQDANDTLLVTSQKIDS